MKKLIVLLFLTSLIACDDEEAPELTILKVYEEARISKVYPNVYPGNSTVFVYYFEAEDDEMIADDEFAEDFFFEINPSANEFTLTTDDLSTINHLYRQYCFCGPMNYSKILSGTVKGTKRSNGDWKVSGEISLDFGYVEEQTQDTTWRFQKELTFDGTFHLTNSPALID